MMHKYALTMNMQPVRKTGLHRNKSVSMVLKTNYTFS